MHLRELFEANGKIAVFAFGRMNPPTIGHKKLVDKMAGYPGDHFLFLSHTQKPKTDPLSFAEKVFFAQKSFGSHVTVGNKDVKTIIQAMQHLQSQGYNEVIYVAGSDRVESFTKLLNTYNGKDYEFDSIDVISAGERDPDAEGAEGMSASKLKAAAREDDFETFKQGVAGDERLAQMMFNKVRAGMGVNVVNDSVSEEAPEDKINKKIVQKAQGMMKPRYSSEIAAMVEDEFEAIRNAALNRYKKANGKIDLYTAYTMAIEDEFPEIPNPIVVFQYMTDPVDPNHQDIVPQEAEDGSWADRADKEYEQKVKSNPKGDGFDGKIKGRWFAIRRDRDSYMDQGMDPEDALDKAAERHGIDPEELERWIEAGNAVSTKEDLDELNLFKTTDNTSVKEQDPNKLKVLDWIADRADGKEHFLSFYRKGAAWSGRLIFIKPEAAAKFRRKVENNPEHMDRIKQALTNIETTSKLFANLGIKHDVRRAD